MSKLKELTWENHQNAERTAFARKLMNGITPEEYHTYLYNQFIIYGSLESLADLEDIEDIRRAKHIGTDLKELESEYGFKRTKDKLKPSAVEYINYLPTLDNEELLAHIYVRHFGDMYGGQMIKKRIPYTTGKMYDFEDVEILKAKVRALLNDDMAEEANISFKYATKLFEELNNE